MTTAEIPTTPAAGALLGTFAGDALGRRWEGARPLQARDGDERLPADPLPGSLVYTDDTQLALALAAHLVEHPRVEPEALRATILEHFEAGRGYGGGMRRLVDLWRSGMPTQQAATAVFEGGSFGNGASMRVAPVGARWRDEPEVCGEVAARQAALTHVHPLGTAGAVLQAGAVAVAARDARFDPAALRALADRDWPAELAAELDRALEALDVWAAEPSTTLAALPVGRGVVAHRSVPAALWCAAVADRPREAVSLALGLGGDADTIAAMAGAVAGAADPGAVPGEWLEAMEDGRRGRSFAERLAVELEEARR